MSNIPAEAPRQVSSRGFTFNVVGVQIDTILRKTHVVLDRPLPIETFGQEGIPDFEGIPFASGIINDWEGEPMEIAKNAMDWAVPYVTYCFGE
jgi:hypothetical protein